MDAVSIATDLREFEASNVQSPDFGSIDVDLYADEMRIAFSDEALMNPTIADPMSLAKANAAVGFAYKLDYKIGTALDLTPRLEPRGIFPRLRSLTRSLMQSANSHHTDLPALRCNFIRSDHVVRQLQRFQSFRHDHPERH